MDDAGRPHSILADLCVKAMDNVVVAHSSRQTIVQAVDYIGSPRPTFSNHFM